MCGITFIASNVKRSSRLIENMTDAISHRGPDDFGYYGCNPGDSIGHRHFSKSDEVSNLEYRLLFGHRRLSIIDLSANGHQPLDYQNRYIIVFNGEIYNYKELRSTLHSHGYRFNSTSDTEVIPAAYDHWGIDCISRFNGMWAFIIYDKKTSQFFISRDRYGIKPLYYTITKHSVAFASEIKALLQLPWITATPNITYLKRYLKSGPEEFSASTSFDGVRKFSSKSYFKGSLDELWSVDHKQHAFWKSAPNLVNEKFSQKQSTVYSEEYAALLSDAVNLRLRSDVPVGSALSGGLDSSSIVSEVNGLLRKSGQGSTSQYTFSSIYKTAGTLECDESSFIDQVSNKFGTRSETIEPDYGQIPSEHERIIYHLENPPKASMISSWYTYKLVSESPVKVMLDGQGADELLAGYSRYYINHLLHLNSSEFDKEYNAILDMDGKSAFAQQAKKFSTLKKTGVPQLYNLMMRDNPLKSFLPLNQRLALDTSTLLENLLHYSDRTSMAFGIESRVPFLDYRLVEFSLSLPPVYKIHQGWTKYIARCAFDNRLPKEVVWRRDKMGWPIPEEYIFRNVHEEWFRETISNSRLIKELGQEKHITEDYLKKGSMTKLIPLLNLAVWEKVFL